MENRRLPAASYPERPTFALLVDSVGYDYEVRVIAGVMDAARTHDVNIVCYTSGASGQLPGVHFGKLYDLLRQILHPGAYDGLILTNTFGDFAQRPQFPQLLARFQSIPLVSIVPVTAQIPYVVVDNYAAIRSILSHLIEQHDYQRFAMIRGPLQQKEGDERYDAFCKVLAEYALPLDQSLVMVGNYHEASGAHAIEYLLKLDKELPDAIVAANDLMAIGALQALQAHGIRVPDDIALTGFDDTDDLVPMQPTITTIRQPIYEQGVWAIEALLAHQDGQPIPLETKLSAPLIIRESCGCTPYQRSARFLPVIRHDGPGAKQPITDCIPRVTDQVRLAAVDLGLPNMPETYAQLVIAFFTCIEERDSAQFLHILRDYITKLHPARDRIDMWEEIVTLLRDSAIACLADPDLVERASTAGNDARMLAVQAKAWHLAQRESRLKYHYSIAHTIEQALIGTDRLDEFANILIERVPALGIPACYVCLFADNEQSSSQLVQAMGYGEYGSILPYRDQLDPSSPHPLPAQLHAGSRRVFYLVTPIFVRTDPIGYIVVEVDQLQNWVYEIVIDRIARAVKQTILLREREELATYLLEKANDLERSKAEAETAALVKSEFLANMSHEIRTPLNAIIGMNSLLLNSNLNVNQRRYAETARHHSRVLMALVNNVLDFSKADTGEMQLLTISFDILELIENAIDLAYQTAVDKQLFLGYYVDEDVPPTLVGDPIRLNQVLVQLLSNAIKFTAAGEVVVSVSLSQSETAQPKLHWRVRDTGIGIASTQAERLFEPFYQVDTSSTRFFGGAGLGLAVSQRFVDLMGGSIWVESELGKGATFHFTANVSLDVKASPASDVNASIDSRLAGKSVLVVCDHDADRRLLHRLLQLWRMSPVFAKSPDAVVSHMGHEKSFDVIIVKLVGQRPSLVSIVQELRKYVKDDTPIFVFVQAGHRSQQPLSLPQIYYVEEPIKVSRLHDTLLVQMYDHTTKPLQGSRQDTGSQRTVSRPSRLKSSLAVPWSSKTDQLKSEDLFPIAESTGQRDFDASMASRYPLRILVAEDNRVNQQILKVMLSRLGYQVDAVADGEGVLAAWQRRDYDLILMDIQMPKIDGLEATLQIRDANPSPRPFIVAVTAHYMQTDREKYLAAGINNVITKPVRLADVIAMLEECSLQQSTGRSDQ